MALHPASSRGQPHQAKILDVDVDRNPSTLSYPHHDESQKRPTHRTMIQDRNEHGDPVSPPPGSLHAVSVKLMERIDSFLADDPPTPLLRDVQAQLRIAMRVVEEALKKYRCVSLLLCLPAFYRERQTGR